MRKFIAIFLAAAMLTAALTACSNNDQKPEDGSSSSTSSTPAENPPENVDIPTAEIVDAIKNAYEPDSLPFIDMLPEELINDRYGLDADSYTEITAQVPMISTFVDTVVVVKAADGKAGEVEAALKAYHKTLVEESIQYPMNIEKVNAGQVVVNGNYVAFIMLGAIDEREDASDSDRASFAEAQTKIGVDAFNAVFASPTAR
ncbi:MAG: DUF4358 domain-containing protein [Oscillospiraceae bacterium]|nr:DUF4358 domain-containing protein [Oscillospiraceae bacterium]